MTWAVEQLTLDTLHKVDHKKELEEVAKLLNKARTDISVDKDELAVEFQDLKSKIMNSGNMEDLFLGLSETPYIREQFSQLEKSSILQEMLGLCRSYSKTPLNSFPPNGKVYCQIEAWAWAYPYGLHLQIFLGLKKIFKYK